MPNSATALDLNVPGSYSSIQAAINYANNLLTEPTPTTTSFRVIVEPGTYTGPITLISNVPIIGRETAKKNFWNFLGKIWSGLSSAVLQV